MVRILLPFAAALAACSPAPKDTAMRNSSPASGTNASSSSEAVSSGAATKSGHVAGDENRAALGPPAEPVSAVGVALPERRADSPAEAQGRRILTAAFVMVGPDGRLTVDLHNGRVLDLRDVVMRARDFCGVQVTDGKSAGQYCGGYAEVAAARPAGVPAPESRN